METMAKVENSFQRHAQRDCDEIRIAGKNDSPLEIVIARCWSRVPDRASADLDVASAGLRGVLFNKYLFIGIQAIFERSHTDDRFENRPGHVAVAGGVIFLCLKVLYALPF